MWSILFFFNDTPPPEIYTLSLHDALPIYDDVVAQFAGHAGSLKVGDPLDPETQVGSLISASHRDRVHGFVERRSEEHTSELQSQSNLVCRLLLEKKNIFKPNKLKVDNHTF